MTNTWIRLRKARIIASRLNYEFQGQTVSEDTITQAMWDDPFYEDGMWLQVDWYGDDDDMVHRVYIGVGSIQV